MLDRKKLLRYFWENLVKMASYGVIRIMNAVPKCK